MLKKTITYKDYNDVERTEDFYFNLSKAELTEMELSTTGGFAEMINNIMQAKDIPAIIKVFKELILKSYGEKSADGKYFMKTNEAGAPLSIAFSYTEAYSKLFMELSTDEKAASDFINAVIPQEAQAANKDQ